MTTDSPTPSDEAVCAASRLHNATRGEQILVRDYVTAAYPIIRADVLAEVVGALREQYGYRTAMTVNWDSAADFIERKIA